ncbi:MAG: hypothetical protein JXA21_16790 [Anaerolineae bacterium]|nr:hypothetical protein [Anaerolineae bacterium]
MRAIVAGGGVMARVTMRPKALNSEMLALIETQAEGTESFTLPGEVAAQMAQLARRALAVASPEEKPDREAGKQMTETRADVQARAYAMVRFLSAEQRVALRMALRQ